MSSVIYVAVMLILWGIDLFNGTGAGQIYHTTENARLVVYVLTIAVACWKYFNNRNLSIDRKDLYSFAFMVILFSLDTFFHGYSTKAFQYLWVFCLIYLVSQFPVQKTPLKVIGICYASLGLLVLYIYNFGALLKGWNPNSIAMVGLNSFLFFIIPFYHLSQFKGKITIAVVAVVYILLINKTESRSCMFFVAVGALFALGIIPYKVFTSSKKSLILWLLSPLIVAVVTVMISKGSYMVDLDKWSMEQFQKPFFNGRDILWEKGFKQLYEHPIFGNGNLGLANWHNSIVACFTAFGISGLILWLNALYRLLIKGLQSISTASVNDSIIIGCLVSFIIIYTQQSIELGFFSSSPTIIPYMMIGVMLGRIKRTETISTIEE